MLLHLLVHKQLKYFGLFRRKIRTNGVVAMWFVFCAMVVLTCFVMCVCVGFVMRGCVYVWVL